MKILLTIHENFLPDSGSAGSTFRLGEEYKRLGHEIYFFSLDDMPKMQRHMRRFMFPEFVANRAANLLKHTELDVIDGAPGDSWICGMISKLSRLRPLVVTRSHGLPHLGHLWHLEEARNKRLQLNWYYHLYRGKYQLWEVKKSLQLADLIFLLNRREADYAHYNLNVEPEKIHVLPNGMPESFMNLPFKSLPKTDDPIRIAQIGTYIQRKGIEYSVPALQNILKRYPNIELSFIGTGFPHLTDPKSVVYADFEPALHSRITVIPYYQHDMLPSLLKDHHINVFPSLSEGFGKALIEAMACGLASVTTDADGPMEIVKQNYDALVVPKRDTIAIEDAITTLIEDRERLETIRKNAYQTAQSYSWKTVAERRLAEYEKALAIRKDRLHQ